MLMLTRVRRFVCFGLVLVAGLGTFHASIAQSPERTLPKATAEHLPRWRGFNLLEKFHAQWRNEAFQEQDFQIIHDLGFNFVRLPMDYRTWIVDGDWSRFDEAALKDIDQAIAWGKQYSVHVCINFHRAPGYTVASPPEATSLWTDAGTQIVCANHWRHFARRYRGIPNTHLSFNLFNEPAGVEETDYVNVVRMMAEAIRGEDPDRLIISDGMQWGQQPILSLAPLEIAQATRGYTPSQITHYRASWVTGSDQFPQPAWPRVQASGLIYGEQKTDVGKYAGVPIRIHANIPRSTRLKFTVGQVSANTRLVVRANQQTVYEKQFTPGPGEGEWKEVRYREQWNVYQNLYDKEYAVELNHAANQVEIAVAEGDWLSISKLALRLPGGDEHAVELDAQYGKQPAQLDYRPDASGPPFTSPKMEDRQWLWQESIEPWIQARAEHQIGVMVGEFGCHNQTPHNVTLAWMEDCLQNWQRAEMGWALWNLRGSFGVLDSERKDVVYENYRGHQLDRKMLDLLKKY